MSNRTGIAKSLTSQIQIDKVDQDKLFLDKNNVKKILNDLIDSLNTHQPDEPINYICNYFENLYQQGDPVKIAYDRLQPLSHKSNVFDDCLLEIYELFLKSGVSVINNKKPSKGCLFDLFNNLIELLASSLPHDIRKELCVRLKRREHEAVCFSRFRSSIKIIYLCKDYLNEWTNLYNELKAYSTGNQVSRFICEILIEQLKNSLALHSSSNLQSAMDSIYSVSPPALTAKIDDNYGRIFMSKESLSLDEFLKLSFECFLKSIQI